MNDNKELKYFKRASCIAVIVMVIIVSALVSLCNRTLKNQEFIDNSIEQVHGMMNHVDSVWNGGEQEVSDSLQ